MVKYGETFYVRHTALNTSCSEVKLKTKTHIQYNSAINTTFNM